MKIKKLILSICLFVVTVISYFYARGVIEGKTKQKVLNNTVASQNNESNSQSDSKK